MKLVIFGGTTEGRVLTEKAAALQIPVTVSVSTEYGAELLTESAFLTVHRGNLTEEEMEQFLLSEQAELCMDATHPYAELVTANIRRACEKLSLPYIRILRNEEAADAGEDRVSVKSVEEAVSFLQGTEGNIFIATGSKELEKYTQLPGFRERCMARILPSEEAIAKAVSLGFSGKHLIAMQGPFSEALNEAMLKSTESRFFVTKSSGKEGGFAEKCRAAKAAGATLIVVERPGAEQADRNEEQKAGKQTMMLQEACQFLEGLSDAMHMKKGSGGREIKVTDREAPDQEAASRTGREVPEGAHICAAREVYLAGMGPGRASLLPAETCQVLQSCEVLIGSARMIKEACQVLTEDKPCFISVRKEEIADYLKEHSSIKRAAVLYSGDVGFSSGARGMEELLPEECRVIRLPGISSPVYFLSELGLSLEEVVLVSCHGKELDLIPLLLEGKKVCALLGGRNQLSELCEKLISYGLSDVVITAGERLSYPEERIRKGRPEDFAGKETDSLTIVLLEGTERGTDRRSLPGLPDAAFCRGRVPMTKEEIRILSLAKLNLKRDSIVYDIGSGSGSVGIEAALFATEGKVYAVEKKEEAYALTGENAKKLKVSNLLQIKGEAPEALRDLPSPTHVFIGGSSGRLPEIIEAVLQKNDRARIVMNAITLETLETLLRLKKENPHCRNMELTQVQITRVKELSVYHLTESENPVWIAAFGGEE